MSASNPTPPGLPVTAKYDAMVAFGALVTLGAVAPLIGRAAGLHPPDISPPEIIGGLVTGPVGMVVGLVMRSRILRRARTPSVLVSDDGHWWWDGSGWRPFEARPDEFTRPSEG